MSYWPLPLHSTGQAARREDKMRKEAGLNPVHEKRKKTIIRLFRDFQSSEKPRCLPTCIYTPPCRRVDRVVKGLESANDMKSNYRQR